MNNLVRRRLQPAAAFFIVVFLGASRVEGATITVRAGEDLQSALNAAQSGDTILLEPGATFTGNFVLPVKGGDEMITISTIPEALPGPGVRISPAHAPLLAKIRSGNSMPALTTAPGAHHWRLTLVEFLGNRDGYGEIIQLGDGSSAQDTLAEVPYELEIDRVYIHGNPVMGQKRGIALNARSVVIRNSHISDIKGVGMDTQAIGGWNGPGPFLIENNYLEAAGENVMLGGADPSIANLVSNGVVVRRNHLTRPMSWRNPVVQTPSDVSAQVEGNGTLGAGTHAYRVVARTPVAAGVVARSTASDEVTVASPAGGRVVLSWTPVPNATEYRVYGRRPSGTTQYWIVTSPAFIDSGVQGHSGSAPTDGGDTWTVKNLLELKNARNVTIEQNVFENHWAGAQAGYSIVFTPRNQDGGCPWCVVEDVTFRDNIVRNVAAGINILGFDDLAPSQQTKRIRITGNLFTNVTRSLGGSGWFLLLGDAPREITVDHNTIDSDGTVVLYVYGGPSGGILPVSQFRFTNNAAKHQDYGISGSDVSFGNEIISAFFPDGEVRGNWLPGGDPSRYPAANYFDGTFASGFANLTNGDYSPSAGGPLVGRATDGTNIGADIGALTMASSAATSSEGGTRPPPPTNVRIVGK